MSRRKKADTNCTSVTILTDRLAWLHNEMGEIYDDLLEAVGAGNHQAIAATRRMRLSIRNEIDSAQQQLIDSTPETAEDLTPEEMHDYHRRRAEQLQDVHLHHYVLAYLRNHRGLYLATPDGPLELMTG